MATDKITIGLTPENRSRIEQIMEQGIFKDKMDAAKFALSVAINEGIEPGEAEGTDTVWNVGSFDSDGQLKLIIPLLFENIDTPYRAVELLLNAGIEIIHKSIEETGDLIREQFMSKEKV